MSDNTTVLIIDDHPLFRRGVRQLLDLTEGFAIVGEAAAAARASSWPSSSTPT